MAFAAAGASLSVGLDICPLAIAAAEAERDKQLAGHTAAAAATQMVVGDFFSYEHSDGLKFDVGYDYTFLVRATYRPIKCHMYAVWSCACSPNERLCWLFGYSRVSLWVTLYGMCATYCMVCVPHVVWDFAT